MMHIPSDIMMDILLRLPCKSLVRFSCTNKHWSSFIQDPSFRVAHGLRQYPSSFTILDESFQPTTYLLRDDEICTPTGRIVLPTDFWFMLPSVTGLICAYGTPRTNCIALINPTIREVVYLPGLPRTALTYSYPQKKMGFGYHIPTNTHKLVQLVWDDYNKPVGLIRCRVLTPGTVGLAWRDAAAGSTLTRCKKPSIHDTAACADGALFWDMHSEASIVAFDLGSEELSFLRLPLSSAAAGRCYWPVVLHGKLCIQQKVHHGLHIWMLEDRVRESWSLRYKLQIGPSLSMYHALHIDHKGRFLLASYEGLHFYNTGDKTLKICREERPYALDFNIVTSYFATFYSETTVSVKEMTSSLNINAPCP